MWPEGMRAPDGKPVELVARQERLDALCGRWRDADALALDTEFVRRTTFYPRPGLLQVADGAGCILIDFPAIGDWSAFRALLDDGRREWIVHAGGEDLALLASVFDAVPARVFDTQIAAAFAGIGCNLGYRQLLKKTLDVEISKGETQSDWLRRPLSDRQLLYAATDVCFLPEMRRLLQERLAGRDRLSWFLEDCARLPAAAAELERREGWERLYAGVGTAWKLDDAGLSILQKLCVWREREARRRDKPRGWHARDAELHDIAERLAATGRFTVDELRAVRSLRRGFADRRGGSLLAFLNAPHDFQPPDRGALDRPLSAAGRRLLKLFRQAAAAAAAAADLPPELLAGKKRLQRMVRGYQERGGLDFPDGMDGWRRRLLEPALARVVAAEAGGARRAER